MFKRNNSKQPKLILSQNMQLEIGNPKARRNDNVFVVGENNNCVFLTNLLESKSNFVIYDINGEYYKQTNSFFRENEYDVKVLDFTCGSVKEVKDDDSAYYNPFHYVKNEADIYDIIHSFLASQPDQFVGSLNSVEKFLAIICAMYLYINKGNVMTFFDLFMLVKEILEDDVYKKLRYLLAEINEKSNYLAIVYNSYLNLLDQTKKEHKGALHSLIIRLCFLNLPQEQTKIQQFISTDNIELYNIHTKKQVIFLILKEKKLDAGINFLASIFFEQLFEAANGVNEKELNYNVICMLNDIQKTCKIPRLNEIITINRNFKFCFMIGCSNLTEFSKSNKDWYNILIHCDHVICLDDSEKDYLSIIPSNVINKKRCMKVKRFVRKNNYDCVIFVKQNKMICDIKYKLTINEIF